MCPRREAGADSSIVRWMLVSLALAEVSNSSHNDAPSTSAQTKDFTNPMDDVVMHDVEKVCSDFAGNESDDET